MNHRGMLVNGQPMRAPAIFGAVIGLALVVAACSAAAPTPTYIQLTPTPVPPDADHHLRHADADRCAD